MTRTYEIKMSLKGMQHSHDDDKGLIYRAIFTLKKSEVDRMLKNARSDFAYEVDEDSLLEMVREKWADQNAEIPDNPVKECPELVIAAMLTKRIPFWKFDDVSQWARDLHDECREFKVTQDLTEMHAVSCRPSFSS